MTDDNSKLIEQARKGDRTALAALTERCRPIAFAIAVRSLRDKDDAEDVTQNVLLHLATHLGEVRDLGGYLRHVTLHRCIDFRRRRATRRHPGSIRDDESVAIEERNVAERVEQRMAIDALPERERTVFLMDHAGGYEHSEIAKELGVSVPTVRARLQSAKRQLREGLKPFETKPFMNLDQLIESLVNRALGSSRILRSESDPEAWLPFKRRLTVLTGAGEERTLDIRGDITPARRDLLAHLSDAGLPVTRVLAGPERDGDDWVTLCDAASGQNLTDWTMDGTYHRFRTATDLALGAIDQLQAFTPKAEALDLPRVTLADRLGKLQQYDGPWREDPTFAQTLIDLQVEVLDGERPLVYTDYLHFFPNFLRIADGRISEIVSPWGVLGDPLLDLAMVWIYDCYPFVHTGFVEQYLVRHDVPRRDFAVRLALQTMTIMARELPAQRPPEGAGYWDSLTGLLRQAREWMKNT